MKISYTKLFKQDKYENERIGLEVEIDDNDLKDISVTSEKSIVEITFDALQKKVFKLHERGENNLNKLEEQMEEEQDKLQKEAKKRELKKQLKELGD